MPRAACINVSHSVKGGVCAGEAVVIACAFDVEDVQVRIDLILRAVKNRRLDCR